MDNIKKDISVLKLDSLIYNTLINNGINNIDDLWSSDRKKLKKFGLKDSEINKLQIKLQLYGLDLNKKVY